MLIEKNKIHNENCIQTMKEMDEGSIDLVITSPPYDNMRHYYRNSSDGEEIEKVIELLFKVVKDGGVVVWVVGDQTKDGNESGTSFRHALSFKHYGFKLFDTMIYQKNARGGIGSNKTYLQSFEYMFVFSKGGFPKTINYLCDRKNNIYNRTHKKKHRKPDGSYGEEREYTIDEYGRRTNIWKYTTGSTHTATDTVAFEHPAVFPEMLVRDHIYSWSNKGDLVYDPFMGSGTVAKVATMMEREWIGSEVSSEYCDIANKRLRVGIGNLFNV